MPELSLTGVALPRDPLPGASRRVNVPYVLSREGRNDEAAAPLRAVFGLNPGSKKLKDLLGRIGH